MNMAAAVITVIWLEEKDIEILKKHHMSVVTNPRFEHKACFRYLPGQKTAG